MHRIYPPAILHTGRINCPHCQWHGAGEDTAQEELFLSEAIELYCPSCEGYLGFIDQGEVELN